MSDRITQADIVGVARSLLTSGGLPALAMRRIATALGVQQSALYWHFENKQQLLGALADEIVAPIELPADDDWRSRVSTLASRLRAELLGYPDGAELVATAIAFRLGGQQPGEQFTAELARAGLAGDDAEIAASVLVHFVLGYTTDEQQHRQAAALGAIAVDPDHTTTDTDDRFVRGLRLIVTGIAAQLDGADRGSSSPTATRRHG